MDSRFRTERGDFLNTILDLNSENMDHTRVIMQMERANCQALRKSSWKKQAKDYQDESRRIQTLLKEYSELRHTATKHIKTRCFPSETGAFCPPSFSIAELNLAWVLWWRDMVDVNFSKHTNSYTIKERHHSGEQHTSYICKSSAAGVRRGTQVRRFLGQYPVSLCQGHRNAPITPTSLSPCSLQ